MRWSSRDPLRYACAVGPYWTQRCGDRRRLMVRAHLGAQFVNWTEFRELPRTHDSCMVCHRTRGSIFLAGHASVMGAVLVCRCAASVWTSHRRRPVTIRISRPVRTALGVTLGCALL